MCVYVCICVCTRTCVCVCVCGYYDWIRQAARPFKELFIEPVVRCFKFFC